MKKLLSIILVLNLITSTVWAYCDARMDPTSWFNCMNREDYHKKMMEMQQQQLDMQKKMLEQQQSYQQRYQQQIQPQQENRSYHTGNFEIDYFNLCRDAAMGKAPHMTIEQFAKIYYK